MPSQSTEQFELERNSAPQNSDYTFMCLRLKGNLSEVGRGIEEKSKVALDYGIRYGHTYANACEWHHMSRWYVGRTGWETHGNQRAGLLSVCRVNHKHVFCDWLWLRLRSSVRVHQNWTPHQDGMQICCNMLSTCTDSSIIKLFTVILKAHAMFYSKKKPAVT